MGYPALTQANENNTGTQPHEPERVQQPAKGDRLASIRPGNLLIADTFNSRVRVVAARSGSFYGQAMTAGDIYTVAGNGKVGFSGDSGPATRARLSNPEGVAADAAGNLLIADQGNNRIRMVTG